MVTLGLSLHRPEMVSITADWLGRHDAICLEEAPDGNFKQMLNGTLSVDDYVLTLDDEYPEFSRRMYRLMRKLNAEGRRIFQVEPYLECLLKVHEFFADGHKPEEINQRTLQYPVYLAERRATGALVAFYRTAMLGSFEETVNAVNHFARLDAARFRLRDSLRAQALAPIAERYASTYVEAGIMHYQLWQLLRKKMAQPKQLRVVFLPGEMFKEKGQRQHIYSPGDLLTLFYIFHPHLRQPEQEKILAARSLIYSKLVTKEELNTDSVAMPHLNDERVCIQTVRKLSPKDCRDLFYQIRGVGTQQARQIVVEYLISSGSI